MTFQHVHPVSSHFTLYPLWNTMKRAGIGMSACMILLSGCQHRSITDMTADAVHTLQGGEINRLHPPTPGYDKPYPHIGHTPTTIPEFPSKEARQAITQNLEEQRDTNQRLSAASGPLSQSQAPNPLPLDAHNENYMTLESQENSQKTSNTITSQKETPSSKSQLIYQPISHQLPSSFPTIKETPPSPVSFPGFTVPTSVNTLMPNFRSQETTGSLLHFQPETDHLKSGQDNILRKIVDNRHTNYIVIHGFGTTIDASSGLNPTDQEHALTIGLLRAKIVAQHLIDLGVPENMIELQADPIGDSTRVFYRHP